MKILIATGIYPPDIGGPATYSKLLFDELPKRNIEVEVLSFGEVRGLPKVLRHFVYFLKLLSRGRKVDLIFAQDTVSVGLPALYASRVLRAKFFVRVPGDYAWEQSVQRFGVKENIDDFQNRTYDKKTEFLKKIQRKVVNGADKVITPSQYFKKLVSGWMDNKDKVYCIYNGIDLNMNDRTTVNFIPKSIISAGRLVSWKGFAQLIQMMKYLPEWKLTIAGDGPMRRELEEIIQIDNLGSRVKLIGQIPHADLMKEIKKSEVFVLNTHFESFSFQVVEAMALGTPVVTTNIGNLSEIVDHEKSGILVSPDDLDAIKNACMKISSDKNFREKIVGEAKEKSKQFSIGNTLDELIKLLMI